MAWSKNIIKFVANAMLNIQVWCINVSQPGLLTLNKIADTLDE